MSAGEVFGGSFLAALGALLAWVVTLLVIRPGLTRALAAARAGMIRRELFVALSPGLAVDRYVTAGLSPEHGMPTLRELQWLLSLTPAERFGWGTDVIIAFERRLPAGKQAEYGATVDDLGLAPGMVPLRPPVALYLETVARGFPIVGTWEWRKS